LRSVSPFELLASVASWQAILGLLTHLDYKTFGFLRTAYGQAAVRLGGFVCVDSLTAYADLFRCTRDTGEDAPKALVRYCERVPFVPTGLLLTDNARCFLSDTFVTTAVRCNSTTSGPSA
jgi:hypothetical protein